MSDNQDWLQTLKSFQTNISEKLNSPSEEERQYIQIDLTKREILISPSFYSDFLAVENDHLSGEIWFETDRYFDGVDLSQATCVVEYINAANEGRICPIIELDTISDTDKLKFCWHIGREATKKNGKIKFLIHFYEVAQQTDGKYYFIYSLSTKPCEATILKSLDKIVALDTAYNYSAEVLEEIYGRLTAMEEKAVIWKDL